MNSPKRHGTHGASKARAMSARDFEQSNATTMAFLGGKERAWMTGRLPETTTKPSTADLSASSSPDQDSTSSPEINLTTEQYKAIRNNDLSSIPFPSGFDRGRYPAQRRRPGGSKNYPSRSSNDITSSQSPPSAPSPRPLANPADTSSEPPPKSSSDATNVLPSPSPSSETRQQIVNIIDLEDESNGTQSPGPPVAIRLEEMAAKYGGLEGLKKALAAAERPNQRAFPVAVTQPAEPRSDAGRSRASTDPTWEQDLIDQPPNANIPLVSSPAATHNKRVQINAMEPRKRVLNYHNQQAMVTKLSQPTMADHSVCVSQNGPLSFSDPEKAEMQNFSRTVVDRLQQLSDRRDQRGSVVERPRLELLRDACARSDLFYLILHQIFCLNHRPQGSTVTLLGLTELHRKGLDVLSYLLVSNEQVAPEAVSWFSTFPLPLELLHAGPSAFQTAHGKVMRCLELLALNWDVMRSQCTKRRYPPLVDELFGHFNIASLTLQNVIFTAILRDIWTAPQDRCYQLAEDIFLRNYKEVMARVGTPVQDIQAYNQSIIDEYECIVLLHSGHAYDVTERQMAPPQYKQSSLEAASSDYRHRSLSGKAPDCSRSTPLHIDIQAAQRDARTSCNGPHYRPASAAVSQGSPPTGSGSPCRHTSSISMLPYQTAGANGICAPQSSSFVQSPTPLQGFQSPRMFHNHQLQIHDQHRIQAMSGNAGHPASVAPETRTSTYMAVAGTPVRPASQILQSNTPGRIHSNLQQPQRPYTGSHTQFLSPQSAGSHNGTCSFSTMPSAQTGPLGSPHSPAPTAHQFIRFDPSLLPSQANPSSTAFHQAHVISPLLSSVDGVRAHGNMAKYFRFIKHVVMPKEIISSKNRHVDWYFSMKKELIDHLAKDRPGSYGHPPTRTIVPGSRLCRIRCIKVDNSNALPTQSEWAATDCIWPGSTSVILNDTALEIRKKSHHGKDLPIDATPLMKEGKNHLKTAVIGFPENSSVRYAVGVEIIQVADEQQITNSIQALPYHEARQRIIARSIQVDPDVQVVHSQIIINITDPFTTQIFKVPVRGSTCRHNQCFDRDIFLETRNQGEKHEPCGPDAFRCPICGADARPQSLIIDGFFVSIRQELERMRRLDAKAIILHELGDWEIKEEEEATGEQGDGSGRRPSAAKQCLPTEVIEIDDD